MHSLNAQPNLSEAMIHQRFKGCYLLESVQMKITASGWPVRIATIKDVQGHNTLEIRLLGNHFLAINHFIGDYVQLEAAIKRFRNGYFYYLAWYEPVIEPLMTPKALGKAVTNSKTDRERCLQAIRQRIQFLPSQSEQSFCFNVLSNLSHETSTDVMKCLSEQLQALDDDKFILELTYQTNKQNEDVGATGELLSQLINKRPYQIWEHRVLGF